MSEFCSRHGRFSTTDGKCPSCQSRYPLTNTSDDQPQKPFWCEYNCIRKLDGSHHNSCPANPNPPEKPERCKHGVHGTDCFECFPKPDYKAKGFHSKSEMKRIECQRGEPKPDATPREPYLDEEHLYQKYEMMKMANDRNMQEKFALSARVAELEGQLKAKVNLETVFVADSYEQKLAAAKAENEDAWACAEKTGSREAKLVAALEEMARWCTRENANDPCSCIPHRALKDFKGGG